MTGSDEIVVAPLCLESAPIVGCLESLRVPVAICGSWRWVILHDRQPGDRRSHVKTRNSKIARTNPLSPVGSVKIFDHPVMSLKMGRLNVNPVMLLIGKQDNCKLGGFRAAGGQILRQKGGPWGFEAEKSAWRMRQGGGAVDFFGRRHGCCCPEEFQKGTPTHLHHLLLSKPTGPLE